MANAAINIALLPFDLVLSGEINLETYQMEMPAERRRELEMLYDRYVALQSKEVNCEFYGDRGEKLPGTFENFIKVEEERMEIEKLEGERIQNLTQGGPVNQEIPKSSEVRDSESQDSETPESESQNDQATSHGAQNPESHQDQDQDPIRIRIAHRPSQLPYSEASDAQNQTPLTSESQILSGEPEALVSEGQDSNLGASIPLDQNSESQHPNQNQNQNPTASTVPSTANASILKPRAPQLPYSVASDAPNQIPMTSGAQNLAQNLESFELPVSKIQYIPNPMASRPSSSWKPHILKKPRAPAKSHLPYSGAQNPSRKLQKFSLMNPQGFVVPASDQNSKNQSFFTSSEDSNSPNSWPSYQDPSQIILTSSGALLSPESQKPWSQYQNPPSSLTSSESRPRTPPQENQDPINSKNQRLPPVSVFFNKGSGHQTPLTSSGAQMTSIQNPMDPQTEFMMPRQEYFGGSPSYPYGAYNRYQEDDQMLQNFKNPNVKSSGIQMPLLQHGTPQGDALDEQPSLNVNPRRFFAPKFVGIMDYPDPYSRPKSSSSASLSSTSSSGTGGRASDGSENQKKAASQKRRNRNEGRQQKPGNQRQQPAEDEKPKMTLEALKALLHRLAPPEALDEEAKMLQAKQISKQMKLEVRKRKSELKKVKKEEPEEDEGYGQDPSQPSTSNFYYSQFYPYQ